MAQSLRKDHSIMPPSLNEIELELMMSWSFLSKLEIVGKLVNYITSDIHANYFQVNVALMNSASCIEFTALDLSPCQPTSDVYPYNRIWKCEVLHEPIMLNHHRFILIFGYLKVLSFNI